jgi:hypothetical protein
MGQIKIGFIRAGVIQQCKAAGQGQAVNQLMFQCQFNPVNGLAVRAGQPGPGIPVFGDMVVNFIFEKCEKNLRFFDVTYSPPIPV